MLHAELWQSNADLAQACLAHPFVRGLQSGDLNQTAFRRYVAQDAFFLRAFLGAYAVTLAKCTSLQHAHQLHTLIGGALDELQLHATYAATLGIDVTHVKPLPAAAAYVDFLQSTAWHTPPGQALAAMAPCMRLYAYLGQALAPARRPDHAYEEWIRTYASPEFEALAQVIEGLLDSLAVDSPAVRAAYRYALQCELDFFAAPLENPA